MNLFIQLENQLELTFPLALCVPSLLFLVSLVLLLPSSLFLLFPFVLGLLFLCELVLLYPAIGLSEIVRCCCCLYCC